MSDEEAQLQPDEGNDWYRFTAVECPECAFDAEEIDMSSPQRELPDHNHPVPQHVIDQLKRQDVNIEGLQQETARMFGTITSSLDWLKAAAQNMMHNQEKQSVRISNLEAKIENQVEMRKDLDAVEHRQSRLAKDFVPRDEFESSIHHVEEKIAHGFSNLKWVIGLLIGAVGGLASLILMGG